MHQNIVDINNFFSLFNWEQINSFLSYSSEKPWFFTEFSFLLVFGFFLLIYAFLVNKNKWKKIYIIAFSLFFYYKSSGPFLGLFVLMIVSDFLFAKYIAKQSGLKKKIYLFISLLYSLSFLLYFKYSNFFITNFNELLGTNFDLNTVFLPIGISFYTFQSISYLVDIYRKEIEPSKDISDYALHDFFPSFSCRTNR